jgi:hypothetical protein
VYDVSFLYSPSFCGIILLLERLRGIGNGGAGIKYNVISSCHFEEQTVIPCS